MLDPTPNAQGSTEEVGVNKVIFFLTVCLASAVAALIGGVPVAKAATCSGGSYDSGYYKPGPPNVNSYMGAYINYIRGSRSSGSIRGYVSISGLEGALRAGIRNTGSGPQAYIEWRGTFEDVWSVSAGTAYYFFISHDSANTYTAHFLGHSPTFTTTISDSSDPYQFFIGHSDNSGSTCNTMDIDFSSLTSTRGEMTKVVASPYNVGYVSSTEFNVHLP
jgi:hypothetical protein